MHEYAVSANKWVKGVNTVYGLLEDTSNEALTLVMSYVRQAWSDSYYREHGEVSLSNEMKYVLRGFTTSSQYWIFNREAFRARMT